MEDISAHRRKVLHRLPATLLPQPEPSHTQQEKRECIAPLYPLRFTLVIVHGSKRTWEPINTQLVTFSLTKWN